VSTPSATADDAQVRRSAPDLGRAALAAIGAQNLGLLIALIVLVLFISSQTDVFLRTANLLNIGQAVAIVGVLAVMQTVVIISGGLDISVGSVAGLTSVVSALLVSEQGSATLGVVGGLGAGLAAGLVNALIITVGRVNPVIATLATLAAFKGAAQLVSDGRAQGYTGGSDIFVWLARGDVLGIPSLIWIFGAVALAAHLTLKYTDVGRNIYAIGGNDTAARLAGIDLNRYILGVYVATGAVAGLAGILLTARTGSGQPVSGSEGLELEAITAAALGGCALQGGRGTIAGTLLAVLLLGVLDNGLTVLGVNPFWQNVAKGALLVIAVVIQQKRSGERSVGIPT
jgi:ribose transport system permease protein